MSDNILVLARVLSGSIYVKRMLKSHPSRNRMTRFRRQETKTTIMCGHLPGDNHTCGYLPGDNHLVWSTTW